MVDLVTCRDLKYNKGQLLTCHTKTQAIVREYDFFKTTQQIKFQTKSNDEAFKSLAEYSSHQKYNIWSQLTKSK